jgi:hypothetical protein
MRNRSGLRYLVLDGAAMLAGFLRIQKGDKIASPDLIAASATFPA